MFKCLVLVYYQSFIKFILNKEGINLCNNFSFLLFIVLIIYSSSSASSKEILLVSLLASITLIFTLSPIL